MRVISIFFLSVLLLASSCERAPEAPSKTNSTKKTSKQPSNEKTPVKETTGPKKQGNDLKVKEPEKTEEPGEKEKLPAKIEGATKIKEVIKEVALLLKTANESFDKFVKAEKAGNEVDRTKYIRLAHKQFEAVLDKLNSMRKKPNVDDDDMWLPKFEQFEKFEQEAGMRLHDIAKRAQSKDGF